jgi:hypothetical protein
MFTQVEKQALDKIKEIDNVESRMVDLLTNFENQLQHPQEIFDTYVRNAKYQLETRERDVNRKEIFFEKMLAENYEAIERLYQEKSEGFPWLAKAYADYTCLHDKKIADWMEKKSPPAKRSAEIVREIRRQKREAEKRFRITKYLLEMYESLFPFLIDFRGEDLDDYIRVRLEKSKRGEEPRDEVVKYTTEGERQALTKQELFQKALDRYWQKKKSPWQIGRDYERYIGYLYESKGYGVYYQGIIEGLEDLGRDLIAKKGKEVEVIQCKYWSQHKTIHEKHICQLFGTTLKYWIENQRQLRKELKIQQHLFPELIQRKQITGVFVTSTSLSETAREFASELGIEVKEKFPFQKYPAIKCNVSRKTGEKIYHLPFDQQYDRTIVEEERNEYYVETVAEAEQLGFRRAFRWRGNKEEKA